MLITYKYSALCLTIKKALEKHAIQRKSPDRSTTVAKVGVVRGGRAWRVLRVAAAGTECDEQWEEELNREAELGSKCPALSAEVF